MNKWRCPHCTEELLGSVNRCWKCGQRVTPPDFQRIVVAEDVSPHLNAAVEAGVQAATAAPVVVVALTVEDLSLASSKEPPRRGSPFAFDTALANRAPQGPFIGQGPYRQEAKGPPAPFHSPVPVGPTQYRRNQGAIGGVVASLILGIVSLAMLPFTVFGSLVALIGVACGIWGMFHERKGVAIVALMFCCFALAISLYMLGFMLYETLNPAATMGPAGTSAAP